MYADDTTLTLSAEDPLVLKQRMNFDMIQIQSWLSANKPTCQETKFMLIESHSKLSRIDDNFSVKDNNIPIDMVI